MSALALRLPSCSMSVSFALTTLCPTWRPEDERAACRQAPTLAGEGHADLDETVLQPSSCPRSALRSLSSPRCRPHPLLPPPRPPTAEQGTAAPKPHPISQGILDIGCVVARARLQAEQGLLPVLCTTSSPFESASTSLRCRVSAGGSWYPPSAATWRNELFLPDQFFRAILK
jgi:hypothetical protein